MWHFARLFVSSRVIIRHGVEDGSDFGFGFMKSWLQGRSQGLGFGFVTFQEFDFVFEGKGLSSATAVSRRTNDL